MQDAMTAVTAISVGPALEQEELTDLEILRGVSLDSVWGLLEHCDLRFLDAGESLLEKGERNRTLFVLLDGELTVHLEDPSERPVARLQRGVSVGELSVLDNSPASAHVVAAHPCRLLAIDEATFWRLARASHEFSTNLLMLLAKRMRATNDAASRTEKERQKLERVSLSDALTGLNNRRWIEQTLPRILERHSRDPKRVAIAIVDIDHFKSFNDTYGHAVGDLVLVEVAQQITTRLRPLDVGARMGGEEFLVVFPDTDASGALAASERLRHNIEELQLSTDIGPLPTITVSIGVAEAGAAENAPSVLQRADAALYRAKANGRNRVEISL